MFCKILTGEIFSKNTRKGVKAELGAVSRAVWAVPVRFLALNKGKAIENWQKGMWDSFLGAVTA